MIPTHAFSPKKEFQYNHQGNISRNLNFPQNVNYKYKYKTNQPKVQTLIK